MTGERFADSSFGFECDIPEGWVSLPAAWVKTLRLTASSTSEELADVLGKASAPFLCAYLPQQDPSVAIPTVQCTVKPAGIVAQCGGLAGVIDAAIPKMKESFHDFQIIQRLEPYLVAGHVGAYLKASMSVLNESKVSFFCISELIVFRTSRFCFILGMSGPANESQRPVEDFNSIIRSIRAC